MLARAISSSVDESGCTRTPSVSRSSGRLSRDLAQEVAPLRRGKQHSRQPRRITEKTAKHRHGSSGGGRPEPTKADLYEQAKRREPPGRSNMSKAELARALKA